MEYILLLVITVSLILSLTNQFFSPFQQFINNYMGDYISCLLETGEFPSTGTTPTSKSECDFKFKPATLKDGRAPIGSNSDPNDSNRNSGRDRDGNGGGGQGSYAGSAGRRASYLDGPPPRLANGEQEGSTKVVEISIGTTEEAGFNARGSSKAYSSSAATRGGAIITYGLSAGEQKKAVEEKKVATRVIASDLPARPSKKVLLKPPDAKDIVVEDKAEEWNIGDYFRFLLIAAIIILLIAVIGGQAARLTKSWE